MWDPSKKNMRLDEMDKKDLESMSPIEKMKKWRELVASRPDPDRICMSMGNCPDYGDPWGPPWHA